MASCWILQYHPAEALWREVGDAGEIERLFVREGVADLDRRGVAQVDLLADAVMRDLHSSRELAGADAEKGYAVAVGRVHVVLNLEGETGEGFLVWSG